MRFLFVSDSFKGSISSAKSIRLLTKKAREVFPDCECIGLPVADGGEGTTDAVIHAVNGKKIPLTVHGPLWDPVETYYGALNETTCVLEMAGASGLPLVPPEKQDPLYTTSYGTGEIIKDALDRGFTDISIAIGGSATNDGGIGCMRALGAVFLDQNGEELSGIGADLEKIETIDISGLHPGIRNAKFTVMCDVDNPLCGPTGATMTFGPQKGADAEGLAALERGMCHYRDLLIKQFGVNADDFPGSGAAGGLGAAFLIFLHGTLKPGIETVLDLIGFDEALEQSDIVITGEGCTDWQSCHGKVLSGIGKRCQAAGKPAIALVGGIGPGGEAIMDMGISSIFTTVNAPMTLEAALENSDELYEKAAERIFRLIKSLR